MIVMVGMTDREAGEFAARLRNVESICDRIEVKVDALANNGCAIGRQHTQELADLKAAPTGVRGWISLVVAGIAAITAVVAVFIKR